MPEITPVEDEPPSWCLISLMVTFNAVLNLCHALSFLWVCFLRLKVSIKIHGALWIFINCWIDIIQFFVMLNFTFRHFNSTIPRKALTICSSLSFGIMLCLQLASLIVGSAKLRSWGHCTIQAFRPTYLVYIILSWCFLGALLIVILVCCLVECCRRKKFKEDYEDLLEEEGRKCCCCCHTHSEQECCSRCHRCCIGYEVDPTRERINNSCCCDNCCSCCIDCCIDCCGEKKVELPPSITDNDIVVINPHHRIIYAPDPNAPATMTPVNQQMNYSGLTGVGSFQNERHFVPAVFYSDVESSVQGTKTPLYIIPSDIPNQQTLFSTTMAPVIPVETTQVEQSQEMNDNQPYIVIDGVKYIMRTA